MWSSPALWVTRFMAGGFPIKAQPRRCSTFTSAPDVGQATLWYFPVHWIMRNRFDSFSNLARCKQPIFIAHGDCDQIVPFSHGERLYRAASGVKKFFCIPGADHNDPLPGA